MNYIKEAEDCVAWFRQKGVTAYQPDSANNDVYLVIDTNDGYETHVQLSPSEISYRSDQYNGISGKELKEFNLSVPCQLDYKIMAKTEEDARTILIEKGGIDIDGQINVEPEDYKNATLL